MGSILKTMKPSGDDNPPKKKKTSQYGLYSGIVTEKGDNDNPTEKESISNMVNYMKNNNPPESDNPSNVYRPKFSHITIAYKKKKQTTA